MGRVVFWVIVIGSVGSLVYFALQKEPAAPQPAAGAVRADAFAPGELASNFSRYGYQFRDASQEQYWLDAQALLNTAPGADVRERTLPDGRIAHFRRSTGEYAVMAGNGVIQTYRRLDAAAWERGDL